MGHLKEMAQNVTMEIFGSSVPLLDGSMEYAKMGLICGGSYKNRNFLKPFVSGDGIDEDLAMIFFDEQTSGGLVFSVSEKDASAVVKELVDVGYEDAAIIGGCVKKEDKTVKVV